MMGPSGHDPRRAGTIWAVNLDEPRPVVEPLVAAEFARSGPADADRLARAMGGDALPEVLRRFQTGGHCHTVLVEGQLAAYGWVSFDRAHIGELNLRVRLLPGEAYIWDCFTLPAFRRNGLYSALLARMLAELEAEGFCRVWIGADADNIASQRGIARAGFRIAADLVVERVLAMRMVWVQGRPGVPENVVAEARRAFLNDRDAIWLKAAESLKNKGEASAESSL